MTTIIINDCKDANAAGRQVARATAILGVPATFIGVTSDLEAAGNIIDALDALDENPGLILANVAPRNGAAKKWPNGTPFGYFWHDKMLVVASLDGHTWSLIKKLRLTKVVRILDTDSANQFRSFDFLPRVAARLVAGKHVPHHKILIQKIPDAPLAIWWIDNFGNCKTTLLPEDICFMTDKRVRTAFDTLLCVPHLKDVKDRNAALVIGSSGLGSKRFLEIVVQGGSAAKKFNLRVGSPIICIK